MPRKSTAPNSRSPFARQLHKLRKARGWSQHELATRANITQPMICYLESGATEPGWTTVQSLAKAFGVSTEEFRGK